MKSFMYRLEEIIGIGGIKKDIAFLIISAVALVFSIFKPEGMLVDPAWVAIVFCGIPIILEAIIGLVTAFDIKADVLVSLALIAAVCIGEDFAAGEVAFIMQLGALLEELTVAKARAGIEKLVNLTPVTARLVTENGEKKIGADEVKVGDVLRVLPGESVPVDGIITKGETSINQSVMTGESLPVDKAEGDEVSSGTVNQFGVFEMRATRVGKDSSIQRMIRLVQSADAGKAKIVGIADRWATWIVVIALTAAVLTWIITWEIIRAVTILVVFCPCALVLATPTAIMAAIGNATKHGFLVREGDALERLAAIKSVAFDKTGTLTYGTPKVTAVVSLSEKYGEDRLYSFAASAEQYSEHPLGKAVVSSFKQEKGENIPKSEGFKMIPGRGVTVLAEGKRLAAGNREMMKENAVSGLEAAVDSAEKYMRQGSTVIYVSVDGELCGYIVLSDTMRKESKEIIARLKSVNVEPILLTGDNINAANALGRQLGIDKIYGNCLPEDKLKRIQQLQESGVPVCMIGDGINDAPALKMAHVGIAMGGVGSDIAIEAADIALVDDEVKELPHLLALSKRMMTTIKCNLSFSMGLNFLAIILAISGILNPVVGALVHNAGSVMVILNSAFLLKWKKRIKSR